MRFCIFTGVLFITLTAAALPVHSSSPLPVTKSNRFAANLQYTGGTGTGYTLEQIRWGDHHSFERIVLEFRSPLPDSGEDLPRMKVETEFYPMGMAIRLPVQRPRVEVSLPPGTFSRKVSLYPVSTSSMNAKEVSTSQLSLPAPLSSRCSPFHPRPD